MAQERWRELRPNERANFGWLESRVPQVKKLSSMGWRNALMPPPTWLSCQALPGDRVRLTLLGGQRGPAAVQLLPRAFQFGQPRHLGQVGVRPSVVKGASGSGGGERTGPARPSDRR
jgi:hypothetical protein